MPDKAIREQALNPTQSFIVKAPAGSGKTHLLTQRFLTLLTTVAAPEEVLAVTFTRKAAAEMRHRLIVALQKANDPKPEQPHEQATWELANRVLRRDVECHWQLIANPNRLRIVTIDALCAYIVNQMPLLSHFGGVPDILDYPKKSYRQAVEQLLEQTAISDPWYEALNTLLLHLDNRIEKIIELLISLLSKRDQWLGYFTDIQQQHIDLEVYLNQALQRVIDSQVVRVEAAFSTAEKNILTDFLNYSKQSLMLEVPLEPFAFWQEIANLLTTQQDSWRKMVDARIGFPSASSEKDKQRKAIKKDYKDRMESYLAEIAERDELLALLSDIKILPPVTLSSQQVTLLRALGILLPVLVAHLQLVFHEAGKVDFVEVMLRALSALGEELSPSHIALRLDYQFRHILIDEYQDTSVTQYRLFEKLVLGWQPNDGRTLFLVGDPMQSIYRFRGAEVSLFMQTEQKGLGGIRLTPLSLKVNFRSTPQVINWINTTFVDILPKQEDRTLGAVPYSKALAHEKAYRVSLVKMHPLIKSDASHRATTILSLIMQERAQDKTATIAVLVRAKKHLSGLIHELKKMRLPFVAHDVEHLSVRSHVMDIMTLLRASIDATDKIAWLAVLRAPWLGLSLTDIWVLAKRVPTGMLWDTLREFEKCEGLSDEAKTRLARFVPLMQLWLAERGRQLLPIWLRGLWIALGGPACYQQPQFLTDIDNILELIEDNTVGGRISHLEEFELKLAELYADVTPQEPLNENEGIIELMTIHKAKGLEFDIVIIPELQAKTVGHESELLLWYECSHAKGIDLLLAGHKAQDDYSDPLYRYVQAQIRKKNAYETERLLYVGATRAKHTLHMLGKLEYEEGEYKAPPKGSFLAMLWPLFEHEQPHLFEEKASEGLVPLLPAIQRLPAHWQLPDVLEKKVQQLLAPRVDLPPNLPELGQFTLRAAGIVFHRVMQTWMNTGKVTSPEVMCASCTLALQRMGLMGDALNEALNAILQGLTIMLGDSKGQWILNSTHQDRRTEWPLSTRRFGAIENIIIDYAFIDETGTRWIVDYKLAHVDEASLADEVARYQPQLQTYQAILQRVESRTVRCALYFPLLPRWIEI